MSIPKKPFEPFLNINYPDGTIKPISLPAKKEEITIGRDEECDIVLDIQDKRISQYQVVLRQWRKSFYVVECSARIPTSLNNEPLDEKCNKLLKSGDLIKFSGYTLEFVNQNQTLISNDLVKSTAKTTPGKPVTAKNLDFILKREETRVFYKGEEIELSRPQYEIVVYLYDHRPKYCESTDLMAHFSLDKERLYQLIHAIRDAFGEDGKSMLQNKTGFGYTLNV